MGVSTTAMLFFGVLIEGGSKLESSIRYDEKEAEQDPSYDKAHPLAYLWWLGRPEDGVRIVEHCSPVEPMYAIAIEDSLLTAIRGYPQVLPTGPSPQKHDEWVAKLKSFCEKYKIPCEKMEWYIVSWWG